MAEVDLDESKSNAPFLEVLGLGLFEVELTEVRGFRIEALRN